MSTEYYKIRVHGKFAIFNDISNIFKNIGGTIIKSK